MAISGYGGTAGGSADIISWSINRSPFAVNEIKTMAGVEQASGIGGLTTINIVLLSELTIGNCSGVQLVLTAGGSCGDDTMDAMTIENCVCTGRSREVSADGFLQYTYDFATAD